jgi:hypothetical protein
MEVSGLLAELAQQFRRMEQVAGKSTEVGTVGTHEVRKSGMKQNTPADPAGEVVAQAGEQG